MTRLQVSPRIFRAYDIRGKVGEGLTEDVMNRLGHAIGSEALEQGESSLIVGADARLSSPAYAAAMIEGILASGCNVVNIGTVPTPILYFATHTLDTGSGVMITGSHNPKDYNGVKIILRRKCLADNQIQELKMRIESDNLKHGQGECIQRDLKQKYLQRICTDIHLAKPFKVVLDCGNAVSGLVAPDLFQALGCEVVKLYCEVDGHFPNHHPDPTVAGNLQDLIARVQAEKADLGIAFDGDGDRVGLVSATGSIVNADQMLMCFIRDLLPQSPGAHIVFDVKSSIHLPRMIRDLGGSPVMCESGHSFVKRRMQETAALLGGEFSAHIFFLHRWYGFDDGLYTAARFLELMSQSTMSCQSLLDQLPTSVSTPELFIPVPDEDKFSLMKKLKGSLKFPGAELTTLDGIRADFSDGWGLIRASNTTPNLVLRFEAETASALERLMEQFRSQLQQLVPELVFDF